MVLAVMGIYLVALHPNSANLHLFCYNQLMTTYTLQLCSHMLFIGLSYHLLTTVVDWQKFTKTHLDNLSRLRLLVLLFSIILGFLSSRFFLELLAIGRGMAYSLFFE